MAGEKRETARYWTWAKIGECEQAHGFPTAEEMRRYEYRRYSGMWYDFEAGESNDPRFCEADRIKFFDVETGDEIKDVLFYHAETHELERLSVNQVDFSGAIMGCCPTVIEKRELKIKFWKAVPHTNTDGTTEATFKQID